ncbi:MAG: hypothetical protein CBE26_03510 [Kiritimatiellaceae bacterium TMED266]|nr:MAG: hypothetical protein CBE26_03510 [Kiritimatiellaceae bacterium TMED266]
MSKKITINLMVALLFIFSGSALGSVIYQESFEALGAGDTLPAGWTWGVQGVNDNGNTAVWSHFPGGAPSGAIYEVETGQGGPDQGDLTLRSYADYGADHNSASEIKTLLRYEHTVTADEAALGTVSFAFDYKSIDIADASRVYVSMNLINGSDYSAISEVTHQVTGADTLWTGETLTLDVSGQAGNILQVGTQIYTTQWSASGLALDNIDVQAIPEPATMGLIGLFGGGLMLARRLNV